MTAESRVGGGFRAVLAGIAAALVGLVGAAAAQSPCTAPVPDAYCGAFVHYETTPKPLDSRIADALGVTSPGQTRAIALVIAVDHYPHLQNADLPAAATDAQRLTDFLVNDQKFDEVIVLRNEAATKPVIDYFLTVYLPSRALEFQKKARLLIAYTGHGTYETGTTRPEFVLAGATSLTDDPANVYKMSAFADDVRDLSAQYFHVLTLINACYGGNFFTDSGGGGDPNGWNEAGAYAITAGDTKTTVPSLNDKYGSLFFDLLISGVQSGEADEEYFRYFGGSDGNGDALQGDQIGIARTGAIETYLSTAFDRINFDRWNKQHGFEKLSHPYIGLAQTPHDTAGGFFFLSTHQAGNSDGMPTVMAKYRYPPPVGAPAPSTGTFSAPAPADADATIELAAGTRRGGLFPPGAPESAPPATAQLPIGPISSLKGHPEIKIFKPPEIYPIHGLDLSSADQAIDWTRFATGRRPTFMYARALGWTGPDKTFKDRWKAFADLGVDRGVYLKYDFCASPAKQLQSLQAIAPPSDSLLPVAIELVTPEASSDPAQYACWRRLGVEGSKDGVLALAASLRARYGKVPLLAGNSYNLGVLTDSRSEPYMLWLHAYGKQSGSLKLGGQNPWTLWQYSGTLSVPGVGPSTTGEVFFGTPEQYAQFKRGDANVALAAAR